MTPVPTQPHPTHPAVTDSMVTAGPGPQVCDDMTVEVALAVMAGARTGHLIVCDNDDQRTGLVTRAQLATARDSAAYTDLLRLRDLRHDGGPAASSVDPGRNHSLPRAVVPSVMGGHDDTSGAPRPALVPTA
ncbi:CBS domain-containing protein [Streptomyces laurentii]|uniref:CBS domain-containing protein n=1 Tax=Streptomyces laurentii TaxID=39478 RepID=UPI0036C7C014